MVVARWAVVIVDDTNSPKLSLSNHTHMATLSPFECGFGAGRRTAHRPGWHDLRAGIVLLEAGE